jgi:hypothetical protein
LPWTVALCSARAALPDGEWVPRRGSIAISVLAPVAPDGADFATTARLRERVRASILENCGEPDAAGHLFSSVRAPLPASAITNET